VAISIASAASYLTDDIIDDLAARVKHCADEVSAALGWRPTGKAGDHSPSLLP
jgi:DNA-binding IclR family transcriptional regulator